MGDRDDERLTEGDRQIWRQILSDIQGIKDDVSGARGEIGTLRQEMTTFRDNVEGRLRALEDSLRETVGSMVADQISQHTQALTNEVGDLTDRIGETEIKLDSYINAADEQCKGECTVIMRGLAVDTESELIDQVRDIFKNKLGAEVTVSEAERFGRDNPESSAPLPVRAVLASNDDRRTVLSLKQKCKDIPALNKVFIERYKSQQELVNEHNWKTVIRAKGDAKFRLANNGRLVAVSDNGERTKVNNTIPTQPATAQNGDLTGGHQPNTTPGGGTHNSGEPTTPPTATGSDSNLRSGPLGDSFPELPTPAASVENVLNGSMAAAAASPAPRATRTSNRSRKKNKNKNENSK